jgi:hypothetical protein
MNFNLSTRLAIVDAKLPRGDRQTELVDLDEPDTWPSNFRKFIEELANDFDPSEGLLDPQVEKFAKTILDENPLRGYHCTRLTLEEIESVRQEGLLPLASDHIKRRIDRILERRLITKELKLRLLDSTAGDETNRLGQIWLFTSTKSLQDPRKVGWLLSAWGGEGINMRVGSRSPDFQVFESIGVPTVVIVALDLRIHADSIHPGLALSALRTLLGLDGGTSIVSGQPIIPEHIIGIEHPSGEYWIENVWTPLGGFKILDGSGLVRFGDGEFDGPSKATHGNQSDS